MRGVTFTVFASVLLFASLAASRERQQPVTRGQIETQIKALYAGNSTVRSAASDNLRNVGTQAVPYLVRILKDHRHLNSDATLAAIKILGDLRAKEAVPALISEIDFNTSGDSSALLKIDSRLLEEYPSVAALVRIGPDAVPALRNELFVGKATKADIVLRTLRMMGGPVAAKAVNDYITDLETRLKLAKQLSQAMGTEMK